MTAHLETAHLEIVGSRGLADVAVVHIARLARGSDLLLELVDGLDPPKPRREKWIVNVSTQVGCPVGCPYCDAGGGFRGNLTADELLAQVAWVLDRHPAEAARCRKLKVHFARMGEPALNDAVIAALARLPELRPMPGLMACVATVAPRGRERWFEALLDVKRERYAGRFQLQFSVNSTDRAARRRLLPVAHWDLEEIARYGERFLAPGERKVVLNFALATGVPFDVEVLAERFDPARFAVKLTPLNPTERGREAGFSTLLRSERAARLDGAIDALGAAGYDVLVSVGDPREDQVGSNCGQEVRPLLARGRAAPVA